MAEDLFYGGGIFAVLQEVGGIGVAQGMDGGRFADIADSKMETLRFDQVVYQEELRVMQRDGEEQRRLMIDQNCLK